MMHMTNRVKAIRNWYLISFITVVLLCFIGTGNSPAAALLGADEAISQIDKSLDGEMQKQTDTDEDKAVSLMNDIAKLKTEASGSSKAMRCRD
jgi:hypothetical protein